MTPTPFLKFMTTRRAFFHLGLAVLAAPFVKKRIEPTESVTIGKATISGLEPGSYYIYAAKAPEINEDVFLGRIASRLAHSSRLRP